jgi:hypothetical protein
LRISSRILETAGADGGVMAGPYQFHQAGTPLGGVAGGDQALDAAADAGGDLCGGKPKIHRPHHLALAHRDAADDLCRAFADADAHQVLLDLAEVALAQHALGVSGELAHRLDIGGEPGKPVRGALLAVEHAGNHPALHHDPLAHLGHRVGQQRLQGGARLAGKLDQFMFGDGAAGGDRHGHPQATGGGVRLRVQCTIAKRPAKRRWLAGRKTAQAGGETAHGCYKINHFKLP